MHTQFDWHWARALLAAAVLAGCATSPKSAVQESMVVAKEDVGGEAVLEAGEDVSPADTAEMAEAPDVAYDFPEYRLGAGDLLSFQTYDDPALNSQVVVRHDGHIALAWVPDINVMDKTREEAEELVKEAYSALYFDPQVSLTVIEARSQFFTVMGDIQQPAQYPYTRPMTLLDGINKAGGLRINQRGGDSFMGAQGQLVKAILLREKDGQRTATEYDLRRLEAGGEHPAFTPIMPGDLIYVPEGINLVYLLGEGVQSRALALREGITLLPFLANAGGFSESIVRMREVVVMRDISEGQTKLILCDVKDMLRGGEQFLLKPGDIIYLPRKRLVNLADFIGRVTRPVTQTTSVARQVLGLYTQAFDAYYTKERFDRLFAEPGATTNTLSILQTIRDLNDFGAVLAPTLATE